MKKIIHILLLLPLMSLAQTTSQNYVKVTSYKVPTLNGTTATDGSGTVTPDKKTINVTYLDGLGRPIQQVAHRQSGTSTDLVVPIQYDAFGRQSKEYLPYARQTATMGYDASAIANVLAFYNTPAYENTSNPYSDKSLEASPLNRVLEQGAPGAAWLVDTAADSDHTIKFDYLINAADVRLLKATSTLDNSTLADNGYYPEKTLYRTITKDEHWIPGSKLNTTEEYRNQLGQVVLKRTYNKIGTSPLQVAHDTYYVYDQFNNLSFVIPPKVSGTISSTVLAGLCYQYRYDHRNRLVEKRLPGKQWEYIVYDKIDRVVATGPANTPFGGTAKGWLVTYYDVFNRTTVTGWYPAGTFTTAARKQLQLDNNVMVYNMTAGTSTVDLIPIKYDAKTYPAGFKLLTVNYYDDYRFLLPADIPASVEGVPVITEVTTTTSTTRGLATGSWTRVLTTAGSTAGETSCTFYDQKARPIRSRTLNQLGGYTYTDSKLRFTGSPESAFTYHKRTNSSAQVVTRDYFTYTEQEQLLAHTHQVNTGTLEALARNEYDVLGQLKSKKVGGPLSGTGFQNVNYSYNIRGWLTEINKTSSLAQTGDPKDLFAFRIGYNTVGVSNDHQVTPLFNGNISETYWLTAGDDRLRKYGYQYDNLNRLTSAVYMRPVTAEAIGSYDEAIGYDKNGNITSLSRTGYLDSDSGETYGIDDLTYKYKSYSNELTEVIDHSNSLDGFRDRVNPDDPSKPDYFYDANGNMITDWNKRISGITYNHLNLPVRIAFKVDVEGQQYIEYIYNALGVKVGKRVYVDLPGDGFEDRTDYLGGFQYLDTVLQFFPTAEGYVNVAGSAFNYVYNYTDHLGNVRVGYTRDPVSGNLKILEENHYYPFGMKHSNYNNTHLDYIENPDGTGYADIQPVLVNKFKYKFNGKELQDEMGLGWYDYQARNYDPAIGRWMNIDPLAEMSRRFSPYTYALNNPVYFIDPDGMMATPPDWYIDDRTGKVLGQDGATTNNVRLIDSRDFNDIKEANGGSTMSTEATAQLQNSDVSKVVTINDTQIQNELQQVSDQSRTVEHQTNIVLDRANAEVKAVRGAPGTDGLTSIDYETRTNNEGVTYNTQGGNLLLGQAHGHNLISDPNKVNIPGTSEIDKNTAASSGITIYSIDAYNTPVGGQAKINRVTPAGVQDNNIGNTRGASGTGTFNVGLDALKRWSGF